MINKPEIAKARRRGRIAGCGFAMLAASGLCILIFTSQHPIFFAIIAFGSAASLYGAWLFLIYGRKLLAEVERDILERDSRKDDWLEKVGDPETPNKGT